MADSSLEERLRGHAEAFDGLLSLIPAKHYYGEDNSDQWKKKKQTKEQAAAARRAKLDPDSAKSAKDIMDERARKRKLEEMEESDIEGVEKEQPRQGLKQPQEKKTKKQKISPTSNGQQETATVEATKSTDDEKRRLKVERKKEKLAKKSELKKEKSKKVTSEVLKSPTIDEVVKEDVFEEADEPAAATEDDEGAENMIDFIEGIEDKIDDKNPSSSSSEARLSPTFDNPTQPSTNTSTSSVIPPATAPKHIKLPTDPELLRARLAARIEFLRAARKADGPDGAPAKNRQELMEARRKKEEQRRAHKKELRRKAAAEEEAKRELALASARDSPASSMMSPSIHSPPHNFSFGRVAFADGQHLADNMASTRDAPRKKGPQDPATALQAMEKKRLRLAGLDDEKRNDIEEKDAWLNAKKRAHGEKVRDDGSLLKKTLKRKEKSKKKSEKEWTERKEGVAKSQAMKQKKREENLKKRREEKGTKGKKSKSKSKKTKVKSRPGFEGSFGSGKRK
ncbi:surfeit locus protein 6-domain-containing protein [Tricladium varicosporioides]|nr:surfeit locus protein 6-domain-containing protein [Hymenoscyphus varicosporioides]